MAENKITNFVDQLFGLKDKVVLVTGASGQLGQVICNAYRNAECKVVGLDKSTQNVLGHCDTTQNEFLESNISDLDSVNEAFDSV